MKTENIIGTLAIVVSMGAVGCGAAPAAVAGGDHSFGGGAIASVPAQIYTAPEPPAAQSASSAEHVHRHGLRVSHMSLHTLRR